MNIESYVFLAIFIIFIIIALTNIIINIDFKINANKAKQLTIKSREKAIKKERKRIKNKIEKAISMGSFSIIINNLDEENYKYFENLGFKIDYGKTFPYIYISWKE